MDTVVDPLRKLWAGILISSGSGSATVEFVGSRMSWQDESPPGASGKRKASGGGVLTKEVPGCSGK